MVAVVGYEEARFLGRLQNGRSIIDLYDPTVDFNSGHKPYP
jgi:hypothetical protein